MKSAKKSRVKLTPEMVAIFFVNRLIKAIANKAAVVASKPIGISNLPTRRFKGNFQRLMSGYLKRRITTARPFIAKLQTTPKA